MGERLSLTHTPIGQEIQLSSSRPIKARKLYLLSNQIMTLMNPLNQATMLLTDLLHIKTVLLGNLRFLILTTSP